MENLLRVPYPVAAATGVTGLTWLAAVTQMLRRLQAAANRWAMRATTRRALAELEPHLLADIGKTFAEARRESAKPFWRA